MKPLQDNFGRSFPYIRLSITDVCNFKCNYCLPEGYQKWAHQPFLNVDEIRRLVTALTGLGAWKFRITGGEPTLRTDFEQIVDTIRQVPGVRKIALTTNGYKLEQQVERWAALGVNALNISVDSLDASRFHTITGHDRLPSILRGIEKALQCGFDAIKLNAVLLKDLNQQDFADFMAFVQHRPVSVRFIELMQTGDNLTFFRQYHLSASLLQQQLLQQGWQAKPRSLSAGPAQEYSHPGYQGRIGFIAPYSKDFCASCNRLRISSLGELHLCLFGDNGYSLRSLLQQDAQIPALQQHICQLLDQKSASHALHQGHTGQRIHLASIGG